MMASLIAHFARTGIARSTVCGILQTFEERRTVLRKEGSGGRAVKMQQKERRRLVKAACEKKGMSQRKPGRRFGVSQHTVCVSGS